MILAILICLKASFQLSAVLIFSLNPRDRTAVKSLLRSESKCTKIAHKNIPVFNPCSFSNFFHVSACSLPNAWKSRLFSSGGAAYESKVLA